MAAMRDTDTRRSPLSRRRLLGLAPVLALALAGCATPFKAEVNRFQQLPAPQGQSFFVTTDNPELQGGIEFGQYADLVGRYMAQAGYVPAADPAGADLAVTLDYAVDNGREKVRSTGFSDPFGFYGYGRRGYYGRRAFAYGFYDPFIFGPGYGPDVTSFTVYTSELDLKIDRVADNQRLFEGKAQAQSRSRNLQYLVPNLVDAMFTEFPGNSGETVRISIAPEEKKVTRKD